MSRIVAGLKKRRRGQALVEMALVLPLLLVLSLGVVDLGLYMYSFIQASNCSREAARRAAVRNTAARTPPYCNEKSIAVELYNGTQTSTTKLANPLTSASFPTAGNPVTAKATKTHDWLVLDRLVPGFPAKTPIRATTVMRMEALNV